MSSLRALLLFLCGYASAAPAADLNRIAIHYRYADGDFPAVIREIDEYARGHAAWSREDSAFVAKHLGVVYAANPDTRDTASLGFADFGDEIGRQYGRIEPQREKWWIE